MSAADIQYAPQTEVPSKRIHIVGAGGIGKLIAHSLRGIQDPPPITLLLHRPFLMQRWKKKPEITVQDGDDVVERKGFDVEFSPPMNRSHGVNYEQGGQSIYDLADQSGMKPHQVAEGMQRRTSESGEEVTPGAGMSTGRETSASQETIPSEAMTAGEKSKVGFAPIVADSPATSNANEYAISDDPIYNLIVVLKSYQTVSALRSIKHRLNKESTICFMQNGMGIIDEINEAVFTDESTRPSYIQGVVSHGAHAPPNKAHEDPFFVVHTGHGTIQLGAIPRRTTGWREDAKPSGFGTDDAGRLSQTRLDNEVSPSGRYIIRTLCRAPVLAAVAFTPIELLQLQLEKLAMNCVINPMTALLDNRNGALLYNFHMTRTMRLLLAEISLVIRSLPELRGLPNVPLRFAPDRLESLVVDLAYRTRLNISSTLNDVRKGNQTEMEYMNGYIVKRGEELGIKPVLNYAFMQMVLGKEQMVNQDLQDAVPRQKSKKV